MMSPPATARVILSLAFRRRRMQNENHPAFFMLHLNINPQTLKVEPRIRD